MSPGGYLLEWAEILTAAAAGGSVQAKASDETGMPNQSAPARGRLDGGRRRRSPGVCCCCAMPLPDGDAQGAGVQVQRAPVLCRQQSRAAGASATVSRCRSCLHPSHL